MALDVILCPWEVCPVGFSSSYRGRNESGGRGCSSTERESVKVEVVFD